jgi:diguanylate cyclase (GGDEF)-like protein
MASPLVALIFMASFLWIWTRWKSLRYFVWFATAFLVFGVAVLLQITLIPRDPGLNILLTNALCSTAIAIFTVACSMRMRIRQSYLLVLAAPALIVAGIAYFFYIDRNLHTRIYIANLGAGAQFFLVGLRIQRAAVKRIDRILGWVLLVSGMLSVPRTLLTIGHMDKAGILPAFVESPFWAWLHLSLLLFIVVLGLTLLATAVSDIVADLRLRSITDPLTGLLNRRGFEEFAQEKILVAGTRPLSLILCDIDNFKSINDSYGHVGGDAVIAGIAALLRSGIRDSDAAGRFGGEEFVLLLTNLGQKEAFSVAERLRQEIEHTHFESGRLQGRTVTASFGIAEYAAGEKLDNFIHRADAMLYAAKRGGRNRSLASSSDEGAALEEGREEGILAGSLLH